VALRGNDFEVREKSFLHGKVLPERESVKAEEKFLTFRLVKVGEKDAYINLIKRRKKKIPEIPRRRRKKIAELSVSIFRRAKTVTSWLARQPKKFVDGKLHVQSFRY
jgi:hypothetical protein